jgi:serine kinase of HPr protein (carbohydrate metabolism regulator)
VDLSGLGFVDLGFELVAEGHEFIDFGDDAVLFISLSQG